MERKRNVNFFGTFRVGNKGQVIIPSGALKGPEFKPGDLLFVMAGRNCRGIAMVRAEAMSDLAEKIEQGLEVVKEDTKET